jgi:hypothetical protein
MRMIKRAIDKRAVELVAALASTGDDGGAHAGYFRLSAIFAA